MKKALISPLESVSTGFRIADVAAIPFDVALPMFWVDVPDDFDATNKYFLDGAILESVHMHQSSNNPPTLDQKNENLFIYTFSKGQELAEHNHTSGGRHITIVKSGTFVIKRKTDDDYQEMIFKTGDITSFTKDEFHSITCKTKGTIHNITIQDKLSNFMFKKRLIDVGMYSKLKEASQIDAILALAWDNAEISIDGIVVSHLKKICEYSQLDVDQLFAIDEFVIA